MKKFIGLAVLVLMLGAMNVGLVGCSSDAVVEAEAVTETTEVETTEIEVVENSVKTI